MKHSHLRGLKLLFCATLALAIVLSLLPAQEAKALKQGQTCPDCGTGILIPISYDSAQHALSCSKTGCIHSTPDGYIWENHHGGNACTGRSICEGCGQEYGSALGHDWQTEWTIDGDVHYHACSRCTERKDETKHTYTWTYIDADTHKGVCACGAEVTEAHHEDKIHNANPEWHYYVCYVCSSDGSAFHDEHHSYGDWKDNWDGTHSRSCICGATETVAHTYTWTYVDDDTHKGVCACGAETTVEHVWNGSHWCGYPRKCKDCGEYYGEVLDHEYWYEYKTDEQHKINCYHCDGLFGREDHSGGTATCIAKAVCEKCKAEYGEYAAHKGGTATCTEKAVCEICGQEYGDPLDHDWATAWTQGDTTHYYACSRCTERKDEAPHSYSWTYVDDDTCKGECTCGATTTEAHYDRWASTCGRQPHCEKCDHDYGTIPEHEMWYEDRGESGHKPNCYHCDTYFFLEPHSGGTATCVSGPICEKCNAEYDEPDLNNHDWGEWTCDPSDMVNHYRVCKRSGCGVKQTEAHHADTFGKDTDGHYYICLVCNPEGFAYRFESHTFGDWKDNGDGTHSRTCASCGRMETVEHSGGAATCTEAAKCEACGVAYGNPLGHDLVDHEAKAPTCTEIGWDAYQTCSRCDYTTYKEKPALGHSGATGAGIAPTCTEPGLTEETYCLRCGQTLSSQAVIPALGHDYVVSSRTITRIYYQCSRCKKSYWTDNGRSRNLLPDLVWNDRDESIGYTAGVAAAGGVKTLTVTPDAEAAAASAWVSLRLRPDDVEQWKREGIGAVAFQCGSARLEITLSALTPDWFHLTAPLDRYVFTLAPEQEGTLVTVEAQTGAEKTPAEGYSGITLVLDGAAQEIGQNGIY